MNPHFGFVTERLAVGDDEYEVSLAIADALHEAGITHILDCRDESEIFYLRRPMGFQADKRFEYLHNPTNDDGKQKEAGWFLTTLNYATRVFTNDSARLYIHCAAGVSRGPSATYAVLRFLGCSKSEATRAILGARQYAQITYARSADTALEHLGILPSRGLTRR